MTDTVLYLLLLVALIGLAAAVYRCLARAALQVRDATDYRTRNDQDIADCISLLDPPAIETQPGTDLDDLITCIEAWDDPDGYRRLRNAIHQTRKENRHP